MGDFIVIFDEEFETSTNFPIVQGTDINDMVSIPGGKMLIVGNFHTVNGQPRNNICMLNPDGSIDTSFDVGTGTNGVINCAIPASTGGGFFLGGEFTSYKGVSRINLVKIDNNGNVVTSFNSGNMDFIAEGSRAVFYGRIYALQILQKDIGQGDELIVGGQFTSIKDTAAKSLATLNEVTGNFIRNYDSAIEYQPDSWRTVVIRAITRYMNETVVTGYITGVNKGLLVKISDNFPYTFSNLMEEYPDFLTNLNIGYSLGVDAQDNLFIGGTSYVLGSETPNHNGSTYLVALNDNTGQSVGRLGDLSTQGYYQNKINRIYFDEQTEKIITAETARDNFTGKSRATVNSYSVSADYYDIVLDSIFLTIDSQEAFVVKRGLLNNNLCVGLRHDDRLQNKNLFYRQTI